MTSVPLAAVGLLALVVVVLFLLAALQHRLERMQRRIAELSRLEAKVDLLLKHAGIAFDPYAGVAADVAQAVRAGKKIKAIKLHLNATGVGLREAKEYVEGVQRRSGLV
jgi:ribosomal protein L7/L12